MLKGCTLARGHKGLLNCKLQNAAKALWTHRARRGAIILTGANDLDQREDADLLLHN